MKRINNLKRYELNNKYFETENGVLYQGDCLKWMELIPDKSIDMILCDLPYGTTQNKWDSVIPFDLLWGQYWRIIKDNSAIVLTAQTPFDKILGMSCIDFLKYEWIWEKVEATGHLNAKKAPMKAHENILVFYKKLPTYNPIMTKGKHVKMVKNQSNASSNYGKQKPSIYESDERYPRSVVVMEKDYKNKKSHPTQKPVALFEYLIKTYTNEEMTVLDNCCGSGTTAIACENLNRKWICIEKEKEYCEVTKNRILKM